SRGKGITRLYKDLIKLRKTIDPLKPLNKRHTTAWPADAKKTLAISRSSEDDQVLVLFNFGDTTQNITVPATVGRWKSILDTEDTVYEGYGSQCEGNVTSNGELSVSLRSSSAIILYYPADEACLTSNRDLNHHL